MSEQLAPYHAKPLQHSKQIVVEVNDVPGAPCRVRIKTTFENREGKEVTIRMQGTNYRELFMELGVRMSREVL